MLPCAEFQFKRSVETTMLDDRDFGMLGQNLGHEHGRRNGAEHVLLYRVFNVTVSVIINFYLD